MVGPDANHAYDAGAAIQLGRRIEELDIGWFETPLPPEGPDGTGSQGRTGHAIAGGEAEFTRWGCTAGSISDCKKIADIANAFGIRVNPHVWGTGAALAASLQLIAGYPV